jgi:hypothetical protein
MASRTWRDLRNDEATPGLSFVPPNVSRADSERPDIAAVNPRLGALIDEQHRLNAEMQSLAAPTSGLNPRDAARFQLASREDRVAEQRAWQQHREAARDRSRERSPHAPPVASSRAGSVPPEPAMRGRALHPAGTMPRSALDAVTDGSSSPDLELPWLRRLDAGSPPDDNSVGTRRRDGDDPPRERKSGRLRDGVADRQPRLRDGPSRRLADHVGRAEDAPRRVRRAVNDQLDRPRQKVKKLAEDWERRRDSVRGDLDRYGSYAEDSKRVLSIVSGGSGNLEQRAEKAIEKLAEQRADEAEHEARRSRALESSRARREEER